MKTNPLGIFLLAIYLIIIGLGAFINLGAVDQFLPILALVAGILMLLGR